jgi:hypothetical protein
VLDTRCPVAAVDVSLHPGHASPPQQQRASVQGSR